MYTTLLWNDAWFEAFLWKFVCGIAEVWKWPQTLQTWAQWKQFLYWKSNSSSKKEFFIYKRRKKDGTTRCYALFESDVYSGKSNRTIALSVSVQLKMADSMDRIVIFVVSARIYKTLHDSTRFCKILWDFARLCEPLLDFARVYTKLSKISVLSVCEPEQQMPPSSKQFSFQDQRGESQWQKVKPVCKQNKTNGDCHKVMVDPTKILVCVLSNWHFKYLNGTKMGVKLRSYWNRLNSAAVEFNRNLLDGQQRRPPIRLF